MPSSILKRSFTKREKIMFLVLAIIVIIAAYYFLVAKNVSDIKTANDARYQELQVQIEAQQKISANLAKMKKELEGSNGVQSLSYVASYDNVKNELDELNSILSGTSNYNVTFDQPVLSGQTVRRNVKLTFSTGDYDSAIALVEKLQNGRYRCEIADMSLTGKMLASGKAESVSGTLNLVFYETTKGSTNLSGLATKDSTKK